MLKVGVDDRTVLDRMRSMSVSKCYRSLNDFACKFGMTFGGSEGRSYLNRDGAKLFVSRLKGGKVDV
jgi:hypothetical protein